MRSSREEYGELDSAEFTSVLSTRIDLVDAKVETADLSLFNELEGFLAKFQSPDLDWDFRRQLNNHSGILRFSTYRNHRGEPSALRILYWLAEHGPGSYGLVYVHDDEDTSRTNSFGASPIDHTNEFRVWRLLRGAVDELSDPFLSPLVPRVNPSHFA